LIIAGIIQDENYFREKVEPFLNDQIVFIGSAGPEKRNKLLGEALALLHPINFEEPFGLSVAEAQLCGTPVIAFSKGSMPELIADKRTGVLVDTIDEATAAVDMLKDISRQECRDWAAARFSKEKMVKDYLALYTKW
jgi:glycosyltransferase involved in cell wall biosynthesis